MKYYRNLIKRKKYQPLIVGFILFLIGLAVTIISIVDIGERSIAWNEYRFFNNSLMEMIGATNIGMLFIGFLNMYFGLIFMPVVSPFAQDEAEFDAKSEGEYIHVFFRKYEFLVKKETISTTDFFWTDNNKKFVTMLRGYQIYNYVIEQYKNLLEKKIEDSKEISKSEVVSKFSNVRIITNEEKIEYIEKHRLKDKPRVFFVITSILLWTLFGIFIFAILGDIILLHIFDAIIRGVVAFILFILGKKSNIAINKNRRLIKRIKEEEMYIVECEIYDKKISNGESVYYYIKITDGNYVVDQWIEVPKNIYEQEDKKIQFYIFDKTGSDIFSIV